MADAKTLVSLSLRDEASRQLKTFEGKFRQTMGGLADTGAEGGGFATLTADVTSLEGAMSMLGATAPQVAIGMAALGLGKQAVEAARAAAGVQALETAFQRLARESGTSGATMLASLRDASSGMISDADLMLAANSAMALGVADNVQEVTNLLQIAIAKGAEFGQAPTKAFGDLINGLGRMSPEILNNIGIIVDADKAYKDYAQSIGTTADALDDQQRMQALVNAVLEDNPDAARQAAEAGDSAAGAFARWDVATQTFSQTAGNVFLPAVAGMTEALTGFLTKVNDVQKIMGGEILMTPEEIDAKIAEYSAMIADLRNPEKYFQSDQTENQVRGYQDQIRMLQQAKRLLDGVADSSAQVGEYTVRTKEEQDAYNRSLWEGLATWGEHESAAQNVQATTVDTVAQIQAAAQGGLAQIARSVAEVQGTDAAVGWLRGASEQIKKVSQDWIDQGYTIQEIVGVLLPQYLERTQAIIDASQAQFLATSQSVDIKPIVDGTVGSLNQMAQSLANVRGIDNALSWLDTAKGQIEEMIAQWVQQGYTIEQITGVLLPNYIAGLDQIIQREIQAAQFGAQIGQQIAAGLGVAIGAANTLMTTLGSAMGFAFDAINGVANDAMPTLNNQASTFVDTMGPQGALGWLAEQKRATEAQIVDWMQAGYTVDEIKSVLLPAYLNKLRSANSEISTMGGGVSQVSSGFDDLRSKVDSIISGATTLDVGLDPANFLPREDAINENARRLAAIMRDGIGNQDWLEEFKTEVPALWEELSTSGDPQAAAARMLQEFQQGLRPELLDKEMIKQRVRAMLLGEENASTLAQEIATELSGELGMSLAQAQQAVAGVMGTGGGAAGAGAQVGPDGAAQGSSFVASWAATVKGQLTEFENTGKSSGGAWGAGFLATVEAGVPAQLVGMLANLVTPAVMANLAAQGSRTGAQ